VNTSRISHGVGTAGEARAGNESLPSAEVQNLLSDLVFTFHLLWQNQEFLCLPDLVFHMIIFFVKCFPQTLWEFELTFSIVSN
jgi:hypothetical protein